MFATISAKLTAASLRIDLAKAALQGHRIESTKDGSYVIVIK